MAKHLLAPCQRTVTNTYYFKFDIQNIFNEKYTTQVIFLHTVYISIEWQWPKITSMITRHFSTWQCAPKSPTTMLLLFVFGDNNTHDSLWIWKHSQLIGLDFVLNNFSSIHVNLPWENKQNSKNIKSDQF